MADQIRRPTGDDAESGIWEPEPSSPTTKWDKVDEASADDDSTLLENERDEGYITFGFPVFTIPAGATIDSVLVGYRHKALSASANLISSVITVNGTVYEIDSGVKPADGVWNTREYEYTVNP